MIYMIKENTMIFFTPILDSLILCYKFYNKSPLKLPKPAKICITKYFFYAVFG